jgi:RimJ/RimL family protein N-acetyltransferase
MTKRIVTDNQNELGEWLCQRTKGQYTPNNGMYIGLEDDGVLCAVVGFDNYNGATISMHVAGEGKKWLTRDFLWFAFSYPFEQLKVKKVIGLVSSGNLDAMKFDKHLGFVEEAVIKDGCPDGDLNFLTMTREQCKFLSIRRP